MGFIIFIHSLVCIFLCIIILMQSGRGGGLTESFASAESLFGAKTNIFLVKTTGALATIFLITCLSLAFLSSKQDESLMRHRLKSPVPISAVETQPAGGAASNPAMTDTKESTENANQDTTQVPPVTNSVQ